MESIHNMNVSSDLKPLLKSKNFSGFLATLKEDYGVDRSAST